jgi:hypothetical protein
MLNAELRRAFRDKKLREILNEKQIEAFEIFKKKGSGTYSSQRIIAELGLTMYNVINLELKAIFNKNPGFGYGITSTGPHNPDGKGVPGTTTFIM